MKLTDLIRYADERGIVIPADLLLDISEKKAKAIMDALEVKLSIKRDDLPLFTLKTPGAVPPPIKDDLVLGSKGWFELPPRQVVMGGRGASPYHNLLSNLDYKDAGHTGFKSLSSTIAIKDGNYTVTVTDEIIVCSKTTALTITLPAATGSGRTYIISNVNTGTVTLEGASSDTIDGELNESIYQYETLQVTDYAANSWVII